MIGKNNDQNLPPINLSNTDKPAANKKSTRKTESILARMPKVRTTTGQSKLGLFDRLRNLSKKDFAYLAAASGVVITLPFAEHYMVKPEASPRVSGFSTGRSAGSGSGDVFEPGNGAYAPGGVAGGVSDVVTPLSARDPSSLIIGPGDGQQAQVLPMQTQTMPNTPSPVKDSPITSAARAGASSATNAATGPFMPSSKLQAHVRGLESVAGGGKVSGGDLWGGKVIAAAKSTPNMSSVGGSVAPKAMSGYNGVARSRTSSGSNSAMEDLKRGAAGAADFLNARNAVQSLDRAAEASVFGGGTAAGGNSGGPGEGQGYKGGGVNNTSNSAQRSVGKESLESELARTKALADLQRQIKWKDYLKLELPKQIIDTLSKAIMDPIGKAISSKISDALAGPSGPTMCYVCSDCTGGKQNSSVVDAEKNKDVIKEMYAQLSAYCRCRRDKCSSASGGGDATAGSPTGTTAATKTNTKYDDKLASAAVYHDATAANIFKSANSVIKKCVDKGTACTSDELKQSMQGKVDMLKEQYANALKKYQDASADLASDVTQIGSDAGAVTFDAAYSNPAATDDAANALEIIGKCSPSVAEGYAPVCSALDVAALPQRARTAEGLNRWMSDTKTAYDAGMGLKEKIATLSTRSGAGLKVVNQSLTDAQSLLADISVSKCDTTDNCTALVMNKLGEPVAASSGATVKASTARDLRAAADTDSVSSLLVKARGTLPLFDAEKAAVAKMTAYTADVDSAYSEYAAIALVSIQGLEDLALLNGKKKDFEEAVNGEDKTPGLVRVFKAYAAVKNLKPPTAAAK